MVSVVRNGDGRRNAKVGIDDHRTSGGGEGGEDRSANKQNHARVASAPMKSTGSETNDNNGEEEESPFVCHPEERSSNLPRAVRRTHRDGEMKSAEAHLVPLVDQLPRVHRAVQEGGDPPHVSLQGGLL